MASKTAPSQPINAIMFQIKTQALKGVMELMAHCSTLMGQLLQLIPRHVFGYSVDTHAWQYPNPQKFTYWSHLGAMLFGQWSTLKSLRDLVFSVNRQAVDLFIDFRLRWQHRQAPGKAGQKPIKECTIFPSRASALVETR